MMGSMSDPTVGAQPPQANPSPQTPTRAKELGSTAVAETATFQEVNTGAAALEREPIPPEVEAWMEKVGQPTRDTAMDNLPQVQLTPKTPTPSAPSGPMYVLPLGEQELSEGMKAGLNDSFRWLATWCARIIEQLKGRVQFRAEDSNQKA